MQGGAKGSKVVTKLLATSAHAGVAFDFAHCSLLIASNAAPNAVAHPARSGMTGFGST